MQTDKKIFKTHRQLLKILRDRGLQINKGSQGSRVIKILEKENYYNVINGYKRFFILNQSSVDVPETYIPKTTFDEIYALCSFDRELRHIHLKFLLRIENNFKTVVSHTCSKNYGYDNYLKLENFDCKPTSDMIIRKKIAKYHKIDISDSAKIDFISSESNIQNITKLFGEIQNDIARQLSKHNEMVSHYMTLHGYIPLWVLVNVLTFGKVTRFYLYMKESDKIDIAKNFGLQFKELHKYMTMLSFARNKCAHDERFFDIKFAQRIHTKSIPNFSSLKLPRDSSGSYTKGICDAFTIAIIFKKLLSKSDFNEFYNLMDQAIRKLSKHLVVISEDTILDTMGYTKNWKLIKKL